MQHGTLVWCNSLGYKHLFFFAVRSKCMQIPSSKIIFPNPCIRMVLSLNFLQAHCLYSSLTSISFLLFFTWKKKREDPFNFQRASLFLIFKEFFSLNYQSNVLKESHYTSHFMDLDSIMSFYRGGIAYLSRCSCGQGTIGTRVGVQ